MFKAKLKDIKIGQIIRTNVLLIVFILLGVFFSIMSDSFFTLSNFRDVIRTNSITGLLAVGLTYVILAGGIDLSVESVTALTGIVAGALSYNPVIAVVAGLGIGLFFGSFNGLILVKTGVQPFIFTLAANRLIRGIILIFTKGRNIYDVNIGFTLIARSDVGVIPIPILIFVIIIGITYLMLNKAKYGRYVYSVGSNEEAARLSGIKTKSIRVSTYVIAGFLAALAGIMLTSRVAAAETGAATGWALDAVAAVIIGGTSLKGGHGGILNTLLGIFIIAILNNGMVLLNVPSNYYQFTKGALIMVAVLLDMRSQNESN
mgnify:CR=1 FL=1